MLGPGHDATGTTPAPEGGRTRAPAPGPEPHLVAPAEWLSLVLRRVEDGTFLLVRRVARDPRAGVDAEAAPGPLTLMQTAPPRGDERLTEAVASLVRTHLGLTLRGEPRVAATARPAHMAHPYTGGPSMGLHRAVACEVAGEPEPDALYAACEAFTAGAAETALATDLERAIFRDGVALLD